MIKEQKMNSESKTTICNKALSLVGEEPISSYDNDTSIAGRACRSHFDLVMATLLEEGHWTFPTVEAELERIEDEEYITEDMPYMYKLPENCVLIQSIYPKGSRDINNELIKWDMRYLPEETKKVIISNCEQDLYCQYTFSPDNLEIFSATFVKALVDGLAYSICMEITKDLQRTQFLLQQYERDKSDALRKSMNEDLSEETFIPRSISCRG